MVGFGLVFDSFWVGVGWFWVGLVLVLGWSRVGFGLVVSGWCWIGFGLVLGMVFPGQELGSGQCSDPDAV